MDRSTWRLDIVCIKCGYIVATTHVYNDGTQGYFDVPERCPSCSILGRNGRPPAKQGASRFTIWRQARKFRKQLQRGTTHIGEG
jgi:hypothetical protein